MFLSDHDYEHLRACGFKPLLMSLLDDLIIYRTGCEMADSRDGFVTPAKSKACIFWLADGRGEALAARCQAAEDAK
ncbi:hypothetical protein [Pseudomonas borbori]|uniref:hypothetical protein n=1 Tax=Pseudomonas borbori TaxID=289003 RepID=UPI000B88AE38|nr:hypothetical protein [Pseudomonas borbori]